MKLLICFLLAIILISCKEVNNNNDKILQSPKYELIYHKCCTPACDSLCEVIINDTINKTITPVNKLIYPDGFAMNDKVIFYFVNTTVDTVARWDYVINQNNLNWLAMYSGSFENHYYNIIYCSVKLTRNNIDIFTAKDTLDFR